MEKKKDFEEVVDEVVSGAQDSLSKSKQKRLEREKANAKKKTEQGITKAVVAIIAIAILAEIIYAIASYAVKAANTLTPSSDFSAMLTDNGLIEGIKASDYVSLCDYKSIEVPISEVTYTDEEFRELIDTALSNHQILKEEGEVKDGDTVNIDYVGSIDGEEFEGGNSQGSGYDLTIGSQTFIDDFEQQLIGYKPGETAIVNVKFPEDYSDENVAGKDAEFTVDIHGIYVNPEYDDDFICAYYSEHGSTVAEYEQYLKDTYYDSQLTAYIEQYLTDNSTVIKYPKAFLKHAKEVDMYEDRQSYEYINQMYAQYGSAAYSSFEEYTGMSDEEYEADVAQRAEEDVKGNLVFQAIVEKEGITVDDKDYEELVVPMYGSEEYFDSALESYGKPYLMLNAVRKKAVDAVKGYAKVK